MDEANKQGYCDALPISPPVSCRILSGIEQDLRNLGNKRIIKEKRDKSDPGNYRPVSLTSVVGQLIEKIVREVIVGHIIKNKL